MEKIKTVYMLRADCGDLIKSGWLIKIGITVNMASRISNIQSGCPFKVYPHIGAKSLQANEIERRFHNELLEFKTNGEWFFC